MKSKHFACRSCGNSEVIRFWSLGDMPLANALLTCEQLAQPDDRFPLDLAFCPQCGLVQITETVSPEKLYREYLYFSSFSDTVVQHAQDLSRTLIESRGLNERSRSDHSLLR